VLESLDQANCYCYCYEYVYLCVYYYYYCEAGEHQPLKSLEQKNCPDIVAATDTRSCLIVCGDACAPARPQLLEGSGGSTQVVATAVRVAVGFCPRRCWCRSTSLSRKVILRLVDNPCVSHDRLILQQRLVNHHIHVFVVRFNEPVLDVTHRDAGG
jgi:hypothetical protein